MCTFLKLSLRSHKTPDLWILVRKEPLYQEDADLLASKNSLSQKKLMKFVKIKLARTRSFSKSKETLKNTKNNKF